MKIYSWNVNGLRAVVRKGEIQKFMAKHQPDVLCLEETKAKQGQAEIDFPGYEEYWNSAERPGYSGTAIFTKIKPLKVENGFPQSFIEKFKLHGDVYGDPNKEGRVITAEFDKFFVVGVYTINIKDDLSRLDIRKVWDKAFIAWCQELEKRKPVVFCGDLNVAHTEEDLARPKEAMVFIRGGRTGPTPVNGMLAGGSIIFWFLLVLKIRSKPPTSTPMSWGPTTAQSASKLTHENRCCH
jgi:exodeoxyribonuclease-3